jgi:hypothetical protein
MVKAGNTNKPMLSEEAPAKKSVRILTRSSYGQT